MGGTTPLDVLQLTADPAAVTDLTGPDDVLVRDDFAGPGGWSTGIADLLADAGLTEVCLEWDAAACATRVANGHHRTIRADVVAYPIGPFLGRTRGYIGSPPCQTFSMAGGGSGREHLELLCDCVRGILLGHITYDDAMTRLAAAGALDDDDGNPDPRNGLILIPARVIRALLDHNGQGPTDLEWVALEQVPTARLVFHAYATALRELGFSARAVVLNSADYGVPQTRERVFVLASRARPVGIPEPTHTRGGEEPDLFGAARLPWISMADALGWRGTVAHKRGAGMAERHGDREPRPTTEPAPTITSGSPRRLALEIELVQNARSNATVRSATEPAPTITGGHDHAERRFRPLTEEAGRFLLNRRTNSKGPLGTMVPTVKVDVGVRPAATLTSKAGEQWIISTPPGHVDDLADVRPATQATGLRITETEGAVIQGFPPAYAWQGATKGKRWEQIGNVVCPPVARRVVGELLGMDPTPLPWHAYAFTP